MRIIRSRQGKISRYATLNRDHYICPECKIHIVRDRDQDMFMCLQCGRRETRSEFRQTLIANVAAAQAEEKKKRADDAARARVSRHLRTKEGKDALSVVYYIRFQNLIKIGTTSDLRVRMSDLPWDELLLTEPGSFKRERERHEQFAELNHHGEWFRADPELLEFISSRRSELSGHNAKWYAGMAGFPWVHGEVDIPGWLTMTVNAHEVIEFNDKIQVDEIEYSGSYYCNDPADEVMY